MRTERESSRFDRSLEDVKSFGGEIVLLSWGDKHPRHVPETTHKWGDITTTFRAFIKSKELISIEFSVNPKGRNSEIFNAKWLHAQREPLENENGLSEQAMDTIIFNDDSKFFFDEWYPYEQLQV